MSISIGKVETADWLGIMSMLGLLRANIELGGWEWWPGEELTAGVRGASSKRVKRRIRKRIVSVSSVRSRRVSEIAHTAGFHTYKADQQLLGAPEDRTGFQKAKVFPILSQRA